MARILAGWHPEDIKAELRKRHGPVTLLSQQWGFSRNAITETLRRHDYSQKVERLIAEAVEVPLHKLWPARWSQDGAPLPRSNSFDPIALPLCRNSQNAKAA